MTKIKTIALVSLNAVTAVLMGCGSRPDAAGIVKAKYTCVGDGYPTTYHITIERPDRQGEDRYDTIKVSKREFDRATVSQPLARDLYGTRSAGD